MTNNIQKRGIGAKEHIPKLKTRRVRYSDEDVRYTLRRLDFSTSTSGQAHRFGYRQRNAGSTREKIQMHKNAVVPHLERRIYPRLNLLQHGCHERVQLLVDELLEFR